jgi:hypothetical protein
MQDKTQDGSPPPAKTRSLLCRAAIAAVGMFALFTFTHSLADVDLWGNVGFVKHLPWSDKFLRINTFSFTEPNHIWINHEWLAEYILYKAYHLFGNPGLLLLKAILGFGLLAVINSSLRKTMTSGPTRVLLLLLLLSTIGYGFSTRPHLFTYLLSASLLTLLLRPRLPTTLLLLAAPLGCIWANLHGAFFIGQILLLLVFLSALITKLTRNCNSWHNTLVSAGANFAFFAGTLLNPYGLELWGFVFDSAAILRPILSEWAPFNPVTQFSDHIDFMVLILITCIAVLRAPRSISLMAFITLILSLLAALFMRRNIPLFAIVAGLTAGGAIENAFAKDIDGLVNKIRPKTITLGLLAASLLSAVFFVKSNMPKPLDIRIDQTKFPVKAMIFLETNQIQANVITFFDWAEYSIWHLYPKYHQFLDGRFKSAYSQKTITDYLNFIYGKDLHAITNYPTEMVFVHVGNPAAKTMRQQPGWDTIYQDEISVIFLKASVNHGPLVLPKKAPSLSFP